MVPIPVSRQGGGPLAHSDMDANLEWVTAFLLVIFGQDGNVCVSACVEAVGNL